MLAAGGALAACLLGLSGPCAHAEEGPTARPHWARRLTGYLTARDGTALRYSVLLPAKTGRFPVIINYSGYDPGAIGGAAYAREDTAMSADLDATLLDAGYAILGVNARGTGCSYGTFDFLGPSYGSDGADAVEWAAAQAWSSGAIGMANWSWAGMSQVATASERPAHLRAIAPGMVITDPRLDSWAIGGVPSQGFVTRWWMFLHSRWLAVRSSAEAERDERCVRQVGVNYAAGEIPAINLPSLLERHPLRDDWIEARTILRRAGRIDVPVLAMEAFQDEATIPRAGHYHDLLDPRQLWLVQTNGNHDLYESRQFRARLVSFLDRYVKGVDNGFERQPHVQIWQETAAPAGLRGAQRDRAARARWVIEQQSYPVHTARRVFWLGADHDLLLEPPAARAAGAAARAADSYAYPVPGPDVDVDTDFQKWGSQDPGWRQGSLGYTSQQLSDNYVLAGPVSADLWVSSTASDTDLQVTLTELRPDGQERYVQRGWLRVSDREQDPQHSSELRPWPCDRPECIAALSPGVPVLARVELPRVSYAFRTGSRLRIWIDAPSQTGENRFDHSSLPATNAIWHDAQHPSRLVLQVIEGDVPLPAERADCASVLMQPCRPDPLAMATARLD